MEEREKQLIAVRVWKDEYQLFKKVCHEQRTTPTAVINKLIRTYPKEEK